MRKGAKHTKAINDCYEASYLESKLHMASPSPMQVQPGDLVT